MQVGTIAELREYIGTAGVSAFGKWLDDLDAIAAAKVTIALTRLAQGNTSALKAIGGGVAELRIHFGPGYRVYLGADGRELWILLRGGIKATQSSDITKAQRDWRGYKSAKRRKPESSDASDS